MATATRPRRSAQPRPAVVHQQSAGPRLATLERVDHDGGVWLRAGGAVPVQARVLADLTVAQLQKAWHAGHPVLVLDEAADARLPVVIGVVADRARRPAAMAVVDGKRVELTGEDEVVLRCGRASVTLTRAGKIILDGAYVATRSAGVNRIQGGSVQIN